MRPYSTLSPQALERRAFCRFQFGCWFIFWTGATGRTRWPDRRPRGRNRRVSPIGPNPGEGLLTEPTTGRSALVAGTGLDAPKPSSSAAAGGGRLGRNPAVAIWALAPISSQRVLASDRVSLYPQPQIPCGSAGEMSGARVERRLAAILAVDVFRNPARVWPRRPATARDPKSGTVGTLGRANYYRG